MTKKQAEDKELSPAAKLFAKMCRDARGDYTPTEWEAKTGVNRMRWSRYEAGGNPQGMLQLREVAKIFGLTMEGLEAALEGRPLAPAGTSLEDWLSKLSDTQYRQLCEQQEGDRLVRWIAITAQVLAGKNTDAQGGVVGRIT
jgi:hypothetical protein